MSKLDTKNDLNRVGLFSELGYISIGDPYKRQGTSKWERFLEFHIYFSTYVYC